MRSFFGFQPNMGFCPGWMGGRCMGCDGIAGPEAGVENTESSQFGETTRPGRTGEIDGELLNTDGNLWELFGDAGHMLEW